MLAKLLKSVWKTFVLVADEFTPDRDNYEYIYKSEDLINLSGKKFRQKKNHLNQFRMQYSNYEYLPITEDIIPLCRETAASWVETHHEEGIEDELVAINLLFDNWDALALKAAPLNCLAVWKLSVSVKS